MAFLPWLAGALGIWGGINQQNAARADAAGLNQVDQQIWQIVEYMLGPEFTSAIMNDVTVEGARLRNSIVNSLGPAIMNKQSMIKDLDDQTLQAAVQAAIQGRVGGAQAALGALGQLGGQYAQIGQGIAAQGNPFSGLVGLIASGAFNKKPATGAGTAAAGTASSTSAALAPASFGGVGAPMNPGATLPGPTQFGPSGIFGGPSGYAGPNASRPPNASSAQLLTNILQPAA